MTGILFTSTFFKTYVFHLSICVAVKDSAKTRKCPVGIYLFNVNNENTKTMCEICSKLAVKAPERRQYIVWCIYC